MGIVISGQSVLRLLSLIVRFVLGGITWHRALRMLAIQQRVVEA